MTAQISDTIQYAGLPTYRDDARPEEWTIAGVAGTGLFDPAAHQLKVVAQSTGCWRGYHCGYRVRDGQLQLVRVTCGLAGKDVERLGMGAGPRLFGAPLRPRFHTTQAFDPNTGRLGPEELTPAGDYLVDGLSAAVDFTGGLLLGGDFIRELYVHMGFQPAYKYKRVVELTFEHGGLQAARDHSEAIARYRDQLGEVAGQPVVPWYLRWFRRLPRLALPPLPFTHRY
ncbi:MAG TPA: hypothetical protein VHW23_02050 [Kofleriaceae bacterium]|jgi:hypothetical protein|nr:hypothetical protein [Kofleriaceae bacterium]